MTHALHPRTDTGGANAALAPGGSVRRPGAGFSRRRQRALRDRRAVDIGAHAHRTQCSPFRSVQTTSAKHTSDKPLNPPVRIIPRGVRASIRVCADFGRWSGTFAHVGRHRQCSGAPNSWEEDETEKWFSVRCPRPAASRDERMVPGRHQPGACADASRLTLLLRTSPGSIANVLENSFVRNQNKFARGARTSHASPLYARVPGFLLVSAQWPRVRPTSALGAFSDQPLER